MSFKNHPDQAEIELFLRGTLEHEESQRIANHLLTGCADCQSQVERAWSVSGPRSQPEALPESSIAHSLEGSIKWADRIDAERRWAPGLVSELSIEPLGRSLLVAKHQKRYQSWAVVEHLCEVAYSLRFDDVHKLVDLSSLAVAICGELDEELYGKASLADLTARSWSNLGNGYSIFSDFRASEECFKNADRYLAEGTGDPQELADSLRLRVGLRLRQKRYVDARALCVRTRELYQTIGDDHRVGISWLLQGTVDQRDEALDEAASCFAQALHHLDPSADPATPLTVRHNLTLLLHQTGRNMEAQSQATETARLYQEAGDRQGYLQFKRIQAAIAAQADLPHVAEQCLLEARNGFIATGMAARAAASTLELAALYLEQKNFVETKRIAEQLLPILQVKGLHEEALAALLVFREAAIKQQLTATLLTETLNLVQERHADV